MVYVHIAYEMQNSKVDKHVGPGELGGLYHVLTRNGREYGLEISTVKHSSLSLYIKILAYSVILKDYYVGKSKPLRHLGR